MYAALLHCSANNKTEGMIQGTLIDHQDVFFVVFLSLPCAVQHMSVYATAQRKAACNCCTCFLIRTVALWTAVPATGSCLHGFCFTV